MDALPDELLVLIFEDLRGLDIQCVRLVSRRFASVAIQFLLDEGHFFLRKHSLSRLESIADHPILCRTLRVITFMTDVAPQFTDIDQWQTQAQGYCQGSRVAEDIIAQAWLKHYRPFQLVDMANRGMPSKLLTAGWTYHLAMVREQADLRNKNTYLQLEKTLRKLFNLRSIAIDSFEDYHRNRMRHLYVGKRSQVWYCWNRRNSLVSGEHVAAQLYATALAASLPRIVKGLPDVSSKISSLHVDTSGFAPFYNACKELASSAAKFEHLGQSSLRRLSFGTTYELLNEIDAPLLQPTGGRSGLSSLIPILSCITNLQKLSLNVITDQVFELEELFKNTSWPKLSELSIDNGDIPQVSFQSFLQRHTATLKALKITGANLYNDSSERLWSGMLQFLMAQLQLQVFELEGDLSENSSGIDLNDDDYWTAPNGHKLQALLVAQYLVVGDSNMDEKAKLTIANLEHDLCLADFESVVYGT